MIKCDFLIKTGPNRGVRIGLFFLPKKAQKKDLGLFIFPYSVKQLIFKLSMISACIDPPFHTVIVHRS